MSGEAGVAMSSLLGDERGPSQGDEMTFANIAGVLPAIDKVTDTSILFRFIHKSFDIRLKLPSCYYTEIYEITAAYHLFLIYQ